ncbi:MAG: class II fructose-bisphosphate aldolase [Anaerolineaceae bacterium]
MINPGLFDLLVRDLALSDPTHRPKLASQIIAQSQEMGVYPAAIGEIYQALGQGTLAPMTIPAFNIRGLTFALARIIWRKVIKLNTGPVIFELAPSETWAGDQTYAEYAAMIFAAACREGYQGPIFLQGDHFAIESTDDVPAILERCQEVISSGFYQIDIDGSHLIVKDPQDLKAFHTPNAKVTSEIIKHLRQQQPDRVHLVLGGEVGEIGGRDTSVNDLDTFKDLINQFLPSEIPGLDKISAQTGTAHGGIVLQNGSTGQMNVDFDLIAQLSAKAREFGCSGIVQHGASTLTMQDLEKLPMAGVIEVHLATQIQNIVFDHPAFPVDLREKMQKRLVVAAFGAEGEKIENAEALTLAQQFYKARWTAWGSFKHELWDLPESVLTPIEDSFGLWVEDIIKSLRIDNKKEVLKQYFKGA